MPSEYNLHLAQEEKRVWLRKLFQDIYKGHRLLAMSGGALTILLPIMLFASFIDERMLVGINIWYKPIKFTVSAIVFNWTLALYLSIYPYIKRKKNIIGNILAWILNVEVLIIIFQAARGEQSHFNTTSALGGALYALMGLGVLIIFLFILFLAFDSFRLKLNTSSLIQWSIRLAWLGVILACFGGMAMSGSNAHTVGIPDGGEGLPFLNWSTQAGDLRVMHFWGFHAMQILPLFAFGIQAVLSRSGNIIKIGTLFTFSGLYLGFIGFTFWQALNGMPWVVV